MPADRAAATGGTARTAWCHGTARRRCTCLTSWKPRGGGPAACWYRGAARSSSTPPRRAPQAKAPQRSNRTARSGREGRVQTSRWVPRRDYQDSAGRAWPRNAPEGTETTADGGPHSFACLTWPPGGHKTVDAIARQGGRYRWKRAKEGFNRPK